MESIYIYWILEHIVHIFSKVCISVRLLLLLLCCGGEQSRVLTYPIVITQIIYPCDASTVAALFAVNMVLPGFA